MFIHYLGVNHFTGCRENRPVTVRNDKKSPKIPCSAVVKEAEK